LEEVAVPVGALASHLLRVAPAVEEMELVRPTVTGLVLLEPRVKVSKVEMVNQVISGLPVVAVVLAALEAPEAETLLVMVVQVKPAA
jgi:phage baseplate assembly protein W